MCSEGRLTQQACETLSILVWSSFCTFLKLKHSRFAILCQFQVCSKKDSDIYMASQMVLVVKKKILLHWQETQEMWVSAIPHLGIYTKETRSERDTCTPMFIAALFIIARTWKQPRCPSADEWIRKLWYIYTMEYYSAIKKNSIESVLMRWMKLEPIIQSEVSQKKKTPIQYTNAYIWNLERC